MKHPLWRIELFGGLRALAIDPVETREAAGPTVSRFRTQKVGALLAYLSFYKNRRHPREVLIDLLWPGSSPQAGRASLSVALSSLRHQFEPPGRGSAGTILLADRFSLGLRPGAITTDVAEFEGALARADGVGGALLSRDDRIATLMQAVGLYRGPLLPGIYDAWIAAEQERLAGLFFDAADRLAGLLMEEGDLSRALACARRLVAQDPLREEAHQRLIQLLLRSGQPGAALRQGRDLEHLLRNEMSDAPSARTSPSYP
jgi:DNA-binding SARP family transcriptional activator